MYCGVENSGGLDRLNNDKVYKFGNVVPCCAQCNYMKKDINIHTFIKHLCRVNAFQIKQTRL